MIRYSKQNINKATEILKETIENLDLIDIFRILHQKKSEYTFSSAHGTFSRIDHIMGHYAKLNKFKSIEIISNNFSDHNGVKLEINHRKRNDNKDKTLQNIWDAVKAILRGKFIAIKAHIRNQEKVQVNKLTFHLKQLDREEQTRPKVERSKS